jgi:SAM-dependent methyltransferase
VRLELFRCPRCRGKLAQAPSGFRCSACARDFAVSRGLPDFFIVPPGEDDARDANLVWERPEVVEARDTLYRLCHRELRGMVCCMAEIGRRTAAGSRILEVGSGTGHFTRWLSESVHPEATIYAFDRSWPMLERTRAQVEGRANVVLFRANARGVLPFAPGSFDVVFVRLTPLGARGVPAVRAAFELLRPGGWYVDAAWSRERYATPPARWATEHGFETAEERTWCYPRLRSEEEYVASLIDGPRRPYEYVDLERARAFARAERARHGPRAGIPVIIEESLLIAHRAV